MFVFIFERSISCCWWNIFTVSFSWCFDKLYGVSVLVPILLRCQLLTFEMKYPSRLPLILNISLPWISLSVLEHPQHHAFSISLYFPFIPIPFLEHFPRTIYIRVLGHLHRPFYLYFKFYQVPFTSLREKVYH